MRALVTPIVASLITAIGVGAIGMFSELPAVAGYAPVCGPDAPPCWLAFLGGNGALVVGVGGAGLVAYTIIGVGVFFAIGQLAAGLLAIAQLGVGLVGFIGQVGGGTVGLGQLVIGRYVRGQVPVGGDGAEYHAVLSRQLRSALGSFGSDYDLRAR